MREESPSPPVFMHFARSRRSGHLRATIRGLYSEPSRPAAQAVLLPPLRSIPPCCPASPRRGASAASSALCAAISTISIGACLRGARRQRGAMYLAVRLVHRSCRPGNRNPMRPRPLCLTRARSASAAEGTDWMTRTPGRWHPANLFESAAAHTLLVEANGTPRVWRHVLHEELQSLINSPSEER